MSAITIRLPGPLRPYADGSSTVEVGQAPCSLGELLAALEREHPLVGRRVIDEQGRIRRHVHVFVGEERASALSDPVDAGAEVTILAAVSGG